MISLEADIKIYRPKRLVGTGAKVREALAAGVSVWNSCQLNRPQGQSHVLTPRLRPGASDAFHGADLSNQLL